MVLVLFVAVGLSVNGQWLTLELILPAGPGGGIPLRTCRQ